MEISISKTRVQKAREVLRAEERRKASEAKASVREKVKLLKEKKMDLLKSMSEINKAQFKQQSALSEKLAKVTQTRMEFETEEQKMQEQLEKLATKHASDSKKMKLKARLDDLNSKLADLGVTTDVPKDDSTTEDKE